MPEIAWVRNLPTTRGVRETDRARIGRHDRHPAPMPMATAPARSLRLFERIGGNASRWSVRVLERPDHESIPLTLASPLT
jgi:hypothetical protein